MADEDFDTRLDQLRRALEVISSIENNPDLQAAAFSHLFGTAPSLGGEVHDGGSFDSNLDTAVDSGRGLEDDGGAPANGNGGRARTRAARGASKRSAKPTVSQDKQLDPAPPNVQSWKEFHEEKKPATQVDRNTSAVFWLKEIAGLEKATVNQVFTLYIDAGWKPPSDPRNSLQVTASQDGYLDTADMADIKLTPRGIGLVRNDLPRPEKKK